MKTSYHENKNDFLFQNFRLSAVNIIVVIGFVVFGTDIVEVVFRGGSAEHFVAIAYIILYMAGIFFAILTRAIPHALFRNPFLFLIIILPLLSVFWSVDRDMTLYRYTMLFGTTIFGLFIGWHYEQIRLIKLLAISVCINVILSTIFIFTAPSIGIDNSEAWAGTWRGAYMHKNGFGAAIGIGLIIIFYALVTTRGRMNLGFAAVFVLGFVLLIGSRSATALMIAFLGLTLAGGLCLWQRARRMLLSILLAIVLFLPLIALTIGPQHIADLALAGIERDVTAHGRTDIWRLVWPYITDRFWLGYGYGSFWQPGFPWVAQLTARLHYAPHYSHNGIIELWIAGGAVSVITFLIVYALALIKAFVQALEPHARPGAGFALVFLVSFTLRNITEASLVQGNDFLWLLFVIVTVSMTKYVRFSQKSSRLSVSEGISFPTHGQSVL